MTLVTESDTRASCGSHNVYLVLMAPPGFPLARLNLLSAAAAGAVHGASASVLPKVDAVPRTAVYVRNVIRRPLSAIFLRERGLLIARQPSARALSRRFVRIFRLRPGVRDSVPAQVARGPGQARVVSGPTGRSAEAGRGQPRPRTGQRDGAGSAGPARGSAGSLEGQRRSPVVSPAGASGRVTRPISAALASRRCRGTTRSVYPNGPGRPSSALPTKRATPSSGPSSMVSGLTAGLTISSASPTRP